MTERERIAIEDEAELRQRCHQLLQDRHEARRLARAFWAGRYMMDEGTEREYHERYPWLVEPTGTSARQPGSSDCRIDAEAHEAPEREAGQ